MTTSPPTDERTEAHRLLDELRDFLPRSDFEMRLAGAFDAMRDHLEQGTPWTAPGRDRDRRHYQHPVFFLTCNTDGTESAGWDEWDAVRGWKLPRLAERLDAHERARCCDWVALLLVQGDDGRHRAFDFHGRCPPPGARPLVPRSSSHRLTSTDLAERAAQGTVRFQGRLPVVGPDGVLTEGDVEGLAAAFLADRSARPGEELRWDDAMQFAREVMAQLGARRLEAYRAQRGAWIAESRGVA